MQSNSGEREQSLQMIRSIMAQVDETFQMQENMLKLSYADLSSRVDQLRSKVQYNFDDRGGMGSALGVTSHNSPPRHTSGGIHTATPFSVTAPGDVPSGIHSSTPIRPAFPGNTSNNGFLGDRLGYQHGPSMFTTGQGSANVVANMSTPMRDPSQMMSYKAPGSAVPDGNDWGSLSMLQQEPASAGGLAGLMTNDSSIMGSPQASAKLTLDDLLARFAGAPSQSAGSSPSPNTGAYTNPFANHEAETSPLLNFDTIYEDIAGGREDSYPGMRGHSTSEDQPGGTDHKGTSAAAGAAMAAHTPSKPPDGSAALPGEKNTIPIDTLRSLHDQHLTTSVRAVYEGGRARVVRVADGTPEDPESLGILPYLPCRVLVEFKRRRVLQYDSHNYVAPGSYVIVGGDRGEDLGLVIYTWCETAAAEGNKDGDKAGKQNVVGIGLTGSLLTRNMGVGNGTVLRAATESEVEQLYGSQAELERRAVDVCAQRVLDHGLPMVIVDAEYQFDKNKLTFFYEAQQRMDFRELVRDLFKTFRARIWMELVDK